MYVCIFNFMIKASLFSKTILRYSFIFAIQYFATSINFTFHFIVNYFNNLESSIKNPLRMIMIINSYYFEMLQFNVSGKSIWNK